MKINRNYKPEVCTSNPKDLYKSMLHNVKLFKRHVLATDGNVMVCLPIKTDESDTLGLVSPAALKTARKETPKYLDLDIGLNGSQKIRPIGIELPRPTEDECGDYPKVSGIAQILRDASRNKTFEVGINVDLLARAAEAFGTKKLRISFGEKNHKAIFVRPALESDDSGQFGVVMPIRID